MRKQVVVGQSVTLDSATGTITRIVDGIHGDIVAVCQEDEFEQAKKENWAPLVIGFRVADIVSVD